MSQSGWLRDTLALAGGALVGIALAAGLNAAPTLLAEQRSAGKPLLPSAFIAEASIASGLIHAVLILPVCMVVWHLLHRRGLGGPITAATLGGSVTIASMLALDMHWPLDAAEVWSTFIFPLPYGAMGAIAGLVTLWFGQLSQPSLTEPR
jgi:hypothetical protein